ncbi:hypothetical protein ABW19_dt0210647 [Dactylella cylindrospora]|nr:hypothetical protein ABW19_dt0210647 [Dactylella cylindrospora]
MATPTLSSPKRPRRASVGRRSLAEDGPSSEESRSRRQRSKQRANRKDPGSDEFKPNEPSGENGTKDSEELEFDEGDAVEEVDGDIPDEGSMDEGDPDDLSDVDGEGNEGGLADDDRGQAPRRSLRPKKPKNSNSDIALHRRMVRRMKDISYWGDHSIDSTALQRKEAARPFVYDISAPSRGNIAKVWYFDAKKEEQALAKDNFIDRTKSLQRRVQLDRVRDAAKIAEYGWQVPRGPLTLLLGPFSRTGQQKKFRLGIHDSIDLTGPDLFHGKNGWIIHAGNEVQSLDWATRQPGDTQYLAVGVKFQEARPVTNDIPPGFAPCVCPSQIQIWRIPITKPNTTPKPPPVLDHTLLTDWGAPIEMKWRPGLAPVGETSVIGHLLALFEDGKARLFEISSLEDASSPIYHLKDPMLTLYLTSCLFTVFTWIDTHSLAFGTSSGSVAIYDLNSTQPSKSHIPTSYYSLQSSYISAIASLAPSFPHLLATSSLDGSFVIHDIREPQVSDTLIHRSRTVTMSTPIAWCEMAQSLCYPEDLCGVLCMGIRKAKRSGGFLCSNNPGDTISTSTGGGGFHPFLLSGGRDGKVRIVNLIRKYFYSKCQAIQQIWFQIEYAPTTGLYRMLEGWKPEMVVHRNKASLGLPFYSYQTNVTKVCWNNNREFATWAAAGMGCGLVRIEDIALDVHQAVPRERSGNKV